MNESNHGNLSKQIYTVLPQEGVVAVELSHSSHCSTGAAAFAAPNKSAALNELLAPALCSYIHITSPNLCLLQCGFFFFSKCQGFNWPVCHRIVLLATDEI